MLPKGYELIFPSSAGQEDSVLVEGLGLAEMQGHRLHGNVHKTREKRAILQWGNLVVPA
jgi:hypothetical protein